MTIAIARQERGDILVLAARMKLEGDLVPALWQRARRQAGQERPLSAAADSG